MRKAGKSIGQRKVEQLISQDRGGRVLGTLVQMPDGALALVAEHGRVEWSRPVAWCDHEPGAAYVDGLRSWREQSSVERPLYLVPPLMSLPPRLPNIRHPRHNEAYEAAANCGWNACLDEIEARAGIEPDDDGSAPALR